ncbi:MAG: hypothetical protein WDW36_004616 [Sanguina aurantia]
MPAPTYASAPTYSPPSTYPPPHYFTRASPPSTPPPVYASPPTPPVNASTRPLPVYASNPPPPVYASPPPFMVPSPAALSPPSPPPNPLPPGFSPAVVRALALTFQMSYDQLIANSTALAIFEANVISLLSTATKIDPALIKILSLSSGSVIMKVSLTSPPNPAGQGGADPVALAQLDAALLSITTSASTIFTPAFQAQYGISGVSAVNITPVPADSSNSNIVPIAVGVAVGVGGCLIVGGIVAAVLILRRRKAQGINKVASMDRPCSAGSHGHDVPGNPGPRGG